MRLPRILSSLFALAVTAPLLSGCGTDYLGGADLAKAADATARKGTARIEMKMSVSGLGLPAKLDLAATGVTALREPRAVLDFDLAPVLRLAGAQAGSDARMTLRFDGSDLYVDPPEIRGANLPGDGSWIAVDLRQIVAALGIDPEAAGALFTIDPSAQLRALRQADRLEKVGTEEIAGAKTTRYKGSYSIDDVVAALPEAKRAAVRKALARLEELGGQDLELDAPVPVEMWVDTESVVRRMRGTSVIPAQAGVAAGRVDIAYELSDFGAELDVSRPEGAEDITGRIVDAIKGRGGALGRGGTSAG